MSKAFDKVRHTPLIVDLFDVGVCGSALTWFASYLTVRSLQATETAVSPTYTGLGPCPQPYQKPCCDLSSSPTGGQPSRNCPVSWSSRSTTYLGVVLDSKLSWDAQVDRIVSKTTRKIGALWRARRSLSRSARRLFVQAVVIPDIVYGSNAFFPALLGRQLDRLGLLQNRAIRAIDGHPPYTTVHPLLVQHWIGELSKRKILVLVWRCLHGKSSATLSVLFVRSAGQENPSSEVQWSAQSAILRSLWRFSAVRRRICTLEPAAG
ncbi:uncharacterized protein LOC135813528 [Sycon ciliatum]|uniref:uncharacterized protein LOC135813528 n=1 Tax=Sycon ciliatum TaxID=27933 RepID=UPI0031F60F55